MKTLSTCLWMLILAVLSAGIPAGRVARAGPYTEAGIAYNDPAIRGWATGYRHVVRGPVDIAYPGGDKASFGSPEDALGPATCGVYDVISLGDGGELTLNFAGPIYDGEGYDLVVFENGFASGGGGTFAELAFVEVSTDGITFARFPSVSLTQNPVEGYDTIDATDVYDLAGKHPGGDNPCQGTGFDLAELADDPAVQDGAVDLARINYVRVVDVIGNGSTVDSEGHPIYDPYPTPFTTGGFDLQAVGVIHQRDCTDTDGDVYYADGGLCGPVDCDDTDAAVHPGAAEEPAWSPTCSDGKDNDCDGLVDGDDPGCQAPPAWDGAPPAAAAVAGSPSHERSRVVNVTFFLLLPFGVLAVRRAGRRRSRA